MWLSSFLVHCVGLSVCTLPGASSLGKNNLVMQYDINVNVARALCVVVLLFSAGKMHV